VSAADTVTLVAVIRVTDGLAREKAGGRRSGAVVKFSATAEELTDGALRRDTHAASIATRWSVYAVAGASPEIRHAPRSGGVAGSFAAQEKPAPDTTAAPLGATAPARVTLACSVAVTLVAALTYTLCACGTAEGLEFRI
jgi:hypothetical protein